MNDPITNFEDETGCAVAILADVARPLSFPVVRDARAIGCVRYYDDGKDRTGWVFVNLAGRELTMPHMSRQQAVVAGIRRMLRDQQAGLKRATAAWERGR